MLASQNSFLSPEQPGSLESTKGSYRLRRVCLSTINKKMKWMGCITTIIAAIALSFDGFVLANKDAKHLFREAQRYISHHQQKTESSLFREVSQYITEKEKESTGHYELLVLDENKDVLIDMDLDLEGKDHHDAIENDGPLPPKEEGNQQQHHHHQQQGNNHLQQDATTGEYTELETAFMNSLNWCTGGESIEWIDKTADAWAQKISEGAVSEPARDNEGKIQDLSAFVEDRMEVVPSASRMDDLPTLIIENECAYVTESTDDCWFDYAGTPIPQQWIPQDDLAFPIGSANGPDFIRDWNPGYTFTVVYVPPQNDDANDEEPRELTSNTDRGLAQLKLRGNSSRDNPKKQMRLRFREENAPSLIPGTAEARTWVLSTKLGIQTDRTYVGNPWAFEAYRRMGELQREYSPTWPEEGSIEDQACRAWSPATQPVNIVYQGRFIGLFNILEQVEVLDNGGRVWVNQDNDGVSQEQPGEIDGITIPTGSYFLKMDLGSVGEFELDEEAFQQPGYPEWVVSTFYSVLYNVTDYSAPLWVMDYPDDTSFHQYSQEDEDPDVHNLRRILEAIFAWADDPIENNDKLAQVIDMKSMARYFIMEELTREGDAYLVSAKWKFVNGKLYHAALWDFGGGIFQDFCQSFNDWPIPRTYIDYEKNTIEQYSCDATTGMPSSGWHVDRNYGFACTLQDCTTYPPGTPLDNSTLFDMSHFFRHLFRSPALQEEFWALWDLLVEHKLVEEDGSDSDGGGDLWSAGALMDQLHNRVQNSAQVDLQMWNHILTMIGFTASQMSFIPGVDPVPFSSVENCRGTLTEALEATTGGNNTDDFSIPGTDWSFAHAQEIGNALESFWTGIELPPEAKEVMEMYFGIPGIEEFYNSAEVLARQKNFIKARLEWIGQQRPVGGGGGSGSGGRYLKGQKGRKY